MRPRRAFLALGLALYALAPIAVVMAVVTGSPQLLAMLIHSFVFGTLALRHATYSTKSATFDRGTLTLAGGVLALDGRAIVRRDELAQAFVAPTEEAVLVRLERRGFRPPLFVRVQDEAEAAALLRALGFDAERTAAEMRIASSVLALPVWRQLALSLGPLPVLLPAIVLSAGPHGNGPLFAASLTALVAYSFVLGFSPTTVRIGTDGLVTRWLGRTRFIDHARIATVSIYRERVGTKDQRGVTLGLRDGTHVRLPTGQGDVGDSDAARLAKRIEDAREAHRRGTAAGTTDMLARGDRALLDWVKFLRGVGAGAVGPRSPAVPAQVLIRVVEDSKAAPIERASAAIAAVESGGDEIKQRVRVAAEATASPKLRVALGRIASASDDAAVAEALEDLDDEIRRRREASG